MKVSDIFEKEPVQWGLRGDPFLWRELKETFREIDMPDTAQELRRLIEKEYEKSTGYSISYQKKFSIERFHSHGMSSSSISPDFWVNSGIPLLINSYLQGSTK